MLKFLFIGLALCSLVSSLTISSLQQEYKKAGRMLHYNETELSMLIDKVADIIENEYMTMLETGVESQTLKEWGKVISQSHSPDIVKYEFEDMKLGDTIASCTMCRSLVNVLIRTIRNDLDEPEIKDLVLGFCEKFNLYTQEVCEGAFELNYSIIRYIIENTLLNSRDICSVMMQASVCSVGSKPTFTFKVNIDDSSEPVTGPKDYIQEESENDLRILHLTDIHYDPLYEPDSLGECAEPLCCRVGKGTVSDDSKKAGYWTDYRDCDTPFHMIDDSLKQIASTHSNIDYVYYTGDIIDHAVWSTTYEYITEALREQYALLKERFPTTPIFPVIGNHESQPLNQFAPDYITEEGLTTQWLYDLLADLWAEHFNFPADALATVRKGGYYSIELSPGFRVITINNNDCYSSNWWLYFDPDYLSKQLQWLHDELKKSEDKEEKVHILAHIPSGAGSCWHVWSREYTRIIERYRNTISGIFNGHTHRDEMNLFYSEKDLHPIAVGWNGGSLTPFSYSNPNYRIYRVDPVDMQVLDHETYIFNLTEANLIGKDKSPVWFKEYSFKEEYGLKDLSMKSLDEFYVKLAKTPSLLGRYNQLKKTMADPWISRECDANCLKNNLCDLSVTTFKDQRRCEQLKTIYDESSGNVQTTPTPVTTPSTGTTPKEEHTTPKECDSKIDPDCDAAVSITSFSISLILAIFLALKLF